MTAPERQAAPGQADLRQRIAQAIGLTRWQAVTDFDGRTVAVDASSATLTAAVLAALQPELDRLRAERDAHAYRVDTLTAVCKSNKRAHRTAVEECDRLTAELAALREQHTAALATAKAAGYRLAADNAAEQRQLHGTDADAEMLVHFLQRGAELHSQFAADHPEQYAATLPTT